MAAAEHDYFLLRAEWLRFKNHIFDAGTDLPTLAAVLDDVRRLVEEREQLLLVYLDLAAEAQVEAIHGWQAYDEVLRGVARALGELKREGVLSPRDIVSVLAVRSDKFLLFLAAPATGFDRGSAAEAADRIGKRLAEALPRHAPSALGIAPALHTGHALLHRDPMLRAERGVHRALDEAMAMCLHQRERDQDRSAERLDSLIAERQVAYQYQPILDLRQMSVVGHEVFSHGPAGDVFEDSERLFALAERTGRLVALERLCRGEVLASVKRHLPQGAKLFLNTAARALEDPAVAGATFVRAVDAQGLRHANVVLEITERVALGQRRAFREALKGLKQEGFGVAIDDMGAGYSSLQGIVEIEPNFLKFDISLVRNIDRSQIKRSLLETLVELSEKIGAPVIAEGIEAESELTTLREMGVTLGQGRHLAPPVAVPEAPQGDAA